MHPAPPARTHFISRPATHLTSLPVELLLQIADHLPTPSLYSLQHASRRLQTLLEPFLHRSLLRAHSQTPGLALLWACTIGHRGLVRYILDHPLHNDPSAPSPIPLPTDLISYASPCDETALIAAVRADRECILRVFRWGDSEYICAPYPAEPIREPSHLQRRLDIARLLLVRGVDFNRSDENHKTALHYAAQYGDAGLCALLLNCGANPTGFDYGHLTPLHLAAYCNRVDTVRLLLRYASVRKTVNVGTEDDDTALTIAAEGGYIEVCRELLEAAADPHLSNSSGYCALELAAVSGRLECVSLLLDFGACTERRNGLGRTALEMAMLGSARDERVVELLRARRCGGGVLVEAESGESSSSSGSETEG